MLHLNLFKVFLFNEREKETQRQKAFLEERRGKEADSEISMMTLPLAVAVGWMSL